MATAAEEPLDGRTARALRTREAIVDACIALLEEGDYRPTAPRIAEEAGVSVRSVFQHFDDLETLHTAVAARSVERVSVLVLPVDPALATDTKIDRLVHQRVQLLEAITPIRRAAGVHEPFSASIRDWLNDGQTFLRAEVARTFAPELEPLTADGRRHRLDAVDALLSWGAWDSLRSRTGRTAVDAEAAVLAGVRSIITA